MLLRSMTFRFLPTPPLRDDELELISPDVSWVDSLLASCAHPQCTDDPAASNTNRSRVLDFLRAAPHGHQQRDPGSGRVPSYHFWMRLHGQGSTSPPVPIAGGISLRIGETPDLEYYVGHIGYNVYPPARGRHYAERSARLLLDLARSHHLRRLWITCNPDNWASRRTCERLGCTMADIVAVPADHALYQRGEHEKCRYWIDL